jgi:hypothetical protein
MRQRKIAADVRKELVSAYHKSTTSITPHLDGPLAATAVARDLGVSDERLGGAWVHAVVLALDMREPDKARTLVRAAQNQDLPIRVFEDGRHASAQRVILTAIKTELIAAHRTNILLRPSHLKEAKDATTIARTLGVSDEWLGQVWADVITLALGRRRPGWRRPDKAKVLVETAKKQGLSLNMYGSEESESTVRLSSVGPSAEAKSAESGNITPITR